MEVYNKIKSDIILIAMFYVTTMFLTLWLAGDLDRDSTDGERRSGVVLRIDAMTGCHYLESSKGSLTPRLDSQGQNVCDD